MGRRIPIGAGILAVILSATGIAFWITGRPMNRAGRPPATSNAAGDDDIATAFTAPATQPKPPVAIASAPPADMLAVLRLDNPAYPTNAPLDVPTDLIDAARIVLICPAYVDPRGNLWLTHPKGRPIVDVLANGVVDHTAVVRERVRFVNWPSGDGPGSAVVDTADDAGDEPPGDTVRLRPTASGVESADTLPPRYRGVTVPGRHREGTHFSGDRFDSVDADFTRAVRIPGGVVVPAGRAVLLLSADLTPVKRVELPRDDEPGSATDVVLAPAGDGVWAWTPWDRGGGSRGAVFIDADGPKMPDPAAGWPDRPIELVPLADGSVLVVAVEGDLRAVAAGRATAVLKLIPAAEKPPTADLLRTVGAMARQLADPDPLRRDAAQRQLEAQGPAAYPVLETLREQLPAEAQVRIETLLGQRLAPTLAGLRPLEGRCHTIARFPGGGCAIRFDGGGTVDDEGTARTIIPATVLIRPGRAIELIDPSAVTDFVPGRQSLQWTGQELIVSDPIAGPRRWVGLTLQPIMPKAFADFDTVVAIDARRRWLLTSARQPGKTLLLDPTLPDPTPRLPVWTVAAPGGVGRTEAGWPAVRRGERLFVLERTGWRVDQPDTLRTPATRPVVDGPGGRRFETHGDSIEATDAAGRTVSTTLPADTPDGVRLAAVGDRLFVYTTDGRVRRYVAGDESGLTLEATFTQGVPLSAEHVWIDPAGRLVMTTANALSIAFPEGRVPRALADLMLRVER